jgi:YVTN family beta-propeller protein
MITNFLPIIRPSLFYETASSQDSFLSPFLLSAFGFFQPATRKMFPMIARFLCLPKLAIPSFLSPHFKPIVVHQDRLFVANTPADTVDVFDTSSNNLLARIPVGIDPVSIAIRPDGLEAWVSNHISDSISVIDTNRKSSTHLRVIDTVQDIDLEKARH